MRELKTISADVTSSAFCKADCIGLKHNFCLSFLKLSEGKCCSDARCINEQDYCSFNVLDETAETMKYHSCPKEDWCGQYKIHPNINGDALQIVPVGDYGTKFKKNTLCTYQISFPKRATKGDKIEVTLEKSYQVKPTFIAAKSFSSDT